MFIGTFFLKKILFLGNDNGYLYGTGLYKLSMPYNYDNIQNFDFYLTMAYSAYGNQIGNMGEISFLILYPSALCSVLLGFEISLSRCLILFIKLSPNYFLKYFSCNLDIQMTDRKDLTKLFPGDTVNITSNNATSQGNQWGVINARFVSPSAPNGFQVI